MKQSADKSASFTRFLGKIKQKSTHFAIKNGFFKRFLSFATIAAIFCGFFCLIFLTSWDSLKKAKSSEIEAISKFSKQATEVFVKEAVAKTKITQPVCEATIPLASMVNPAVTVLKAEKLCKTFKIEDENQTLVSDGSEQQAEEKTAEELEKEEFKEELQKILGGTPMEEMIDVIGEQPRIVAAYLVGIALKESSFGEHSPSKNGVNCYNYWGYKGATNPTMGGYSCFSSPEEAVEIVGKRLEKFAIDQKRDTPAKMIVWKCGSSCETHSPESVSKWISDVSKFFYKLNKVGEI